MTLKQEAAALFADTRKLLAKHDVSDLFSTGNVRPLTKHNMAVRQAALEAIDAENGYFDSAKEDAGVDLLRTRFERSNMIAVDLE